MAGSNHSRPGLWLALGFAWKLGYSIAVPLVALLLAGRWLDQRLGTSPWLLITGLIVSFIFTNILMFREAVRVMKQGEESKKDVPSGVGEGKKSQNNGKPSPNF
jgi:F0F1-type ATP synthase assembly protein I